MKIFQLATSFLIGITAFGVDGAFDGPEEEQHKKRTRRLSAPPPDQNPHADSLLLLHQRNNRELYWEPIRVPMPTPAPTTQNPTRAPVTRSPQVQMVFDKADKALDDFSDAATKRAKAGGEKISQEVNRAVKKAKRSRRRMLTALNSTATDGISYTCQHELYSLRLYLETVNNHIDVLAVPSELNMEECQQALDFDDSLTGNRMVQFVDDLRDSYIQDDWESASFFLGNFTMGEIMAAADSARVVEGEWDAVTNNCATFALDMFRFLDIPITRDIKRFVVRTFVQSSSFVQQVRNSPHAMELVSSGSSVEDLTDSQLMWHLVSIYVNRNAEELAESE